MYKRCGWRRILFNKKKDTTHKYFWFLLNQLGPVLVNDMQTPSPLKRAIMIFGPKWHVMLWNEGKTNFPTYATFIFWTMVDSVLNFQMFLTYQRCKKKCCLKRCAMFWNGFLSSWVSFCTIFSFWDIADFVFNSGFEFRLTWNGEFRGAVPP